MMRYANIIGRIKRNTGSLTEFTATCGYVVLLTRDVLLRLGVPCRVVREEADSACARHCAQIGGYLLSMDSDMHCFDLGLGYYIPLSTVLYSEDSFTATRYNHAETENVLGVNLVQLATLMGAEGSTHVMSASDAMRLIKSGGLVNQKELKRVTELFSIAGRLAEDVGLAGTLVESLDHGNVWLPIMLEDVKQSSTIACGEHYRAAAYQALIVRGLTDATKFTEYTRHGLAISGKRVSLQGFETSFTDKYEIFIEIMILLIRHYKIHMSEHLYHALIVCLVGTYSMQVDHAPKNVLQVLAAYQSLAYSICMYLDATGQEHPDMSMLYDGPTILIALALLEQGHSLESLTKGHEEIVTQLLESIDYQKKDVS